MNNKNGALPHPPGRQDRLDPAGKSADFKGVIFVVLMLALTGMFVFFGSWQLLLLDQKQRLLALVQERVENAPIGLPPPAEWVGFDPEIYNFRPLRVTGTFDFDATVLVSTTLFDSSGSFSGPGYWVMVPLYLESGAIVFINRGFVPDQAAARFKQGGAAAPGLTTITGLGRISEQANSFTPGTDFQGRIDWVRNIERLSLFLDDGNARVAPIYIDAGAGEPDALPQGGETQIYIAGRQLEFALVWFFLAAVTPLMLVFWLVSNRRKTAISPTPK